MEGFITPGNLRFLEEFIRVSKRDPQVEFECKLLPDQIQTKDVADRLMRTCELLSVETKDQEPYMNVSYKDRTRVTVRGANAVHKVCMTNSFNGIENLTVERKEPYGGKDTIDATEIGARFTLRKEVHIRKDTNAKANDPTANIRIITRRSYTSKSGLFQIDMSMVKSRKKTPQLVRDILKEQHSYELEIEFVKRDTKLEESAIVTDLLGMIEEIYKSFYQTQFLLSVSDMQRYKEEFEKSGSKFYNLVTLERRHIREDMPHNILQGYTVTNKADGERCGLYVSRDRKLLRIISNTGQITWTGYTAKSQSHFGDFVDGEFISGSNLFCIFDMYHYRGSDAKNLPLMLESDEKTMKNPTQSRLGCSRLFVEDLEKDFTIAPTSTPIRIETKLFFAGDDKAMETSIQDMLAMEFEYETDGLIFTPRMSRVAPPEDREKNTWIRVYKWKPASQNSIDFLLRISGDETFDPLLKQHVKEGQLFVSRTSGDIILYPRKTITGEYVQPELPEDLRRITENKDRIPSLFQPTSPPDPEAYRIYLPLNERKLPVDKEGVKIETNTIVECAYDTDMGRWIVMRTRYDKTYQYRVLKAQQYGNDIRTANSVWSSIHVPVTKDMIMNVVTNPIHDSVDSDMYYRDDLKRNKRVFADVYNFHLQIKEKLYRDYVRPGETLLELASGNGGDLPRWIMTKPSKVVAMDLSLSNITSPTKGAAVRYIEKVRNSKKGSVPPVLFVQGDMAKHPLLDQEDEYLKILKGEATGSTTYLKQFENLNKFDAVSCQFALHYACASEDSFRAFAQNIKNTCKSTFFGTCSDGQQIYTMLFDKQTHSFGMRDPKTGTYAEAGKYTKEYKQTGAWHYDARFGMPVSVLLESFEQPQTEYLVPFESVVEVMGSIGFELIDTALFEKEYTSQTATTLNDQQQSFSFLNRTFVFRRVSAMDEEEDDGIPTYMPLSEKAWDLLHPEKKEPTPVPAPESAPEPPPEEQKPEETPPPPEEPKKVVKRKLKKAPEAPEPEPILFHGPTPKEDNSQNYSNESSHPVLIDNVNYKTVEHYVQAQKAKVFNDEETYEKILKKAKTATSAKKYGEEVRDFKTEIWETKRDEIMETGVRAKFVQHPSLRKQLTDTGDKVLGDADARDFYWGIGTSASTEKSKTPSKWKGMNKMGKLLMKLRKEFQEEATS